MNAKLYIVKSLYLKLGSRIKYKFKIWHILSSTLRHSSFVNCITLKYKLIC